MTGNFIMQFVIGQVINYQTLSQSSMFLVYYVESANTLGFAQTFYQFLVAQSIAFPSKSPPITPITPMAIFPITDPAELFLFCCYMCKKYIQNNQYATYKKKYIKICTEIIKQFIKGNKNLTRYFNNYNIKYKIQNMPKVHNDTTQVHECAFEAAISHTNAAVRFSCTMFLAWKNMSGKTLCRTINNNVTVQNGVATFNESIAVQTYMMFDKASSRYLRKETSLCLMLISARKPDQQKLVGRVVVDLGQILNQNTYSSLKDYKLQFCSINNATITFSINLLSNIKTDLKPFDLDMEQYSIISRNLNQSSSSANQDLHAFKSIISPDKQKIQAQTKLVKSDIVVQQQKKIETRPYQSQIIQKQQKKQQQHIITPQEQLPQVTLPKWASQNKEQQQIKIQVPNDEQNQNKEEKQQVIQRKEFNNYDNDLMVSFAPMKAKKIQARLQQLKTMPKMQIILKKAESYDDPNLDSPVKLVQSPTFSEKQQIIQEQKLHPQKQSQQLITSSQILQLRFQNKKLQGENTKLLQLLDESNRYLDGVRQNLVNSKLQSSSLQSKLRQLQQEKNVVTQELLSQAQESGSKCIQLQEYIKQLEQKIRLMNKQEKEVLQVTNQKSEKVLKKLQQLQNQFNQSQNKRLDLQAELLQVKFELSELKSDKQQFQTRMRYKDEELEKLYRTIEQYQTAKALQQIDRSKSFNYPSYSLMSDKQKQGFNQEVQILRRKLKKLTKDLQFTEAVKQNYVEFDNVLEGLVSQRDTLLTELQSLKQQKKLKNSIQLGQLRRQPSELDIKNKLQCMEEQLRALSCLLERNQVETTKLQNNNKILQKQVQLLKQNNNQLKQLLQQANKKIQEQKLQKNAEILENNKQFQKQLSLLQKQANKANQQQLQKANKQIEQSSKKIEAITEQLRNISSQFQNTIKQKQKKEKQLQNFKNLKQSLQNQCQNIKIIRDDLQKQVQNTKKQKQDAQKQIQNLKKQIQTKQKQIDKIKQSETGKTQQIKKLQQDILQKSKIIQKNQIQIKSKQQQKLKIKNVLSSAQQQVLKIQKQFNHIRSINQLSNNTLRDRQQTIKNYKKQLGQYQTVLKGLQNDKNRLEISNKSYKQQVNQLSTQNQELKVKIIDLIARIQINKQHLQPMQHKLHHQDKQQHDHVSHLNQVILDKQRKIQQLGQQLQVQALKILQLEDRVARFSEKQLKMRENILILEEQSRKIYDIVVQKQLNEQNQAQMIEQRQLEIDTLRKQLSQLIPQNQILKQQLNQYKHQLLQVKRQSFLLQNRQKVNGLKEKKSEEDLRNKQQVSGQGKQSDDPKTQEQLRLYKNQQYIESLKEVLRRSRERINQLEENLIEKEGEMNNQYQERIQLMKQLQNQLLQSRNIIVQLKQQTEQLNRQKEHLQKQRQMLQNIQYNTAKEKAVVQRQRQQLIANTKQLTDDKEKLLADKEALSSEKQALTSQNLALLTDKQQLVKQNNKLNEQKAKILSQKQKIEKQRQLIVEQKNNIEKELQSLYKEKSGVEQQNYIIRTQRQKIEKELKKLKQKIEKQKQSKKSQQNNSPVIRTFSSNIQNKQLQQKITQLQQRQQQYKANLQQKDKIIKQLQMNEYRSKSQLIKKQKDLEQLQIKINSISLLLADKEKDLQSINQHYLEKLNQKQLSLSELKAKQANLQRQLVNKMKLISGWQQKQQSYTTTRKDQDALIFKLNNKCQQLELLLKQASSANVYTAPQNDHLINQLLFHQDRIKNLQSQIQMLENQVSNQTNQIQSYKANIVNLKSQIDDNQVQKMNVELQKQFQLVKDKSKQELRLVQKNNYVSYPDIVEACRCLQQLLRQRTQKDKTQAIIQLMVSKNAILQEQLGKITEERGVIQQNARKLSMQFQKIKFKILKGKGSYQQKNQILNSLKPCQGKVKDLVQLTQRLSDNQLEAQND